MNTSRPRGRTVPAPDQARLARAMAAYEDHREAMEAFAQALPPVVRLPDGRTLRQLASAGPSRAYGTPDGMRVIVSLDPTPHGMLRHVSVSYADRDPSWADLRAVRAALFDPGRDVIQLLPRAGEYVNLHAHCFHLFDAPETWQGGLFV